MALLLAEAVEYIQKMVADNVTDKYVQDMSDEVIKRVDLDAIIRRVMLNREVIVMDE